MKKYVSSDARELVFGISFSLVQILLTTTVILNYHKLILCVLILISIFLVFHHFMIYRRILKHINTVAISIENGSISQLDQRFEKLEIINHLQKIYQKQLEMMEFVQNIERSDFKLKHINSNEKIGQVLLELSNKQKLYIQQEEKRNWINEGIALFSDILRAKDQSLKFLSMQILRSLIKYLNANQGGFFVAFEEDGNRYMKLIAIYAYDR